MREKKNVGSMGEQARSWSWRALEVSLVLTAICWAAYTPTSGAEGRFIANNTPGFVAIAKNLGPEDPSRVIDVTLWLNLRNRDEFDSLAKDLYDPTSPHYRQWLKRAEFAARFAPTAEQAKTVEEFLSAHNLPVVEAGPENAFVRARGTLADVQRAFHVQINKFELNGKAQRANTSDPYVEGPAAALVRSVSGLDDLKFEHPLATRANQPLLKGVPPQESTGARVQSSASTADASFFSNQCFTAPRTESFTTYGGFPKATYTGNGYYAPNDGPGCGYTPPEIYTAYHLTDLYKEGYDGTGQTIVIIDFCGSPTILQDANAFSARFGLPPLNSSNFQIIEHPAAPECSGASPEISLDVEWAHAIAPGAKIDLLIAGSGLVTQSDEAEYYAVLNGLGNVISGSYGAPEAFLPSAELLNQGLLNEIAAVFGVSANFATGDDGDFSYLAGVPTVSTPASTPWATAVGGVSLALNRDNSIRFQTGWGNNFSSVYLLATGGVADPPFSLFLQGSGGGTSSIWGQWYQSGPQKACPPSRPSCRQIPDISWLADPYTGAVVIYTIPHIYPPQVWSVVGGTSLACPMFSALWAIANQEAGMPLGQAAPYLYSMPKGTITDVVPHSSTTDVTGTIYESSSTETNYTAAELAAPLFGTTRFYSVLYNSPFGGETDVITFGTDSSLTTAVGWDNATGLGTPNGKAFADYFNPARRELAP